MTSFPDLSSFHAIAASAKELTTFDDISAASARERQKQLTKPPGSLGRLEELAVFMAGWRRTALPEINNAQALVFAGNHGVCAQGVSRFPQEVTAQMVANFAAGGAAINQLCRIAGADLSVVALDLEHPTEDISMAPAMTEDACLRAIRTGADSVDADADVLILGEMGIGNSTVSAALSCAVFGGAATDWVGPGSGTDGKGIAKKADIVAKAVLRHAGLAPLESLTALGGREQAAICGAVLAARAASIPVILDGFICTAAVAPLFSLAPPFLDHCLIGHASAEPGHRRLVAALEKRAILDFDMALGEGSGAALALNILRAALACHTGMATFAEAGVASS